MSKINIDLLKNGLSIQGFYKSFQYKGSDFSKDGYDDYEFTDCSKKSSGRLWVLTHNKIDNNYYAELRRADFDGVFRKEGVLLSRKMTLVLVGMLMFDGILP